MKGFAWFVVFALGLAATPAPAQVTEGFSSGNEFEWVGLHGTATVVCNDFEGGTDIQTYSCYRPTLDPAEYVRFVTNPGGSATKVNLSCTRQDGSMQTKTANFDPAKGVSRDRINLWIATLFQRPLLKPGLNTVSFELLRSNGQVERTGQFIANVNRGRDRYCRNHTYFSSNINDCRGLASICDRYFADLNWCN